MTEMERVAKNSKGESLGVSTKIASMLEQCSGLVGTSDLDVWETEFISSIYMRVFEKKYFLSERQEEHVRKIWKKHFAGIATPIKSVEPAPAPAPAPVANKQQDFSDDIPF